MFDNFDELLTAALSDSLDEEIRSIEQIEKVQPSEKMKGVVLGLCKKEKNHSNYFNRVLKRCAVFLLVFFSSVSLILLTAPEVRGAVQQVILTWTEKELVFNFNGKSIFSDAVSVNISFIPDGYVLVDTFDDLPDLLAYTWTNSREQEIYLSCFKITQGAVQGIDNEHGELSDIAFSAQDVVYIRSNTLGYPNYLSWTKDGYSVLLVVPENFSDEVIIQIAEGVKLNY